MPKVAMKAGIPNRTATIPLINPATQPSRMPAAKPASTGQPAYFMSHDDTTAHKPATEPTERSISPAIISQVWPTAMMPTNAMARSIEATLL